MGMSQQLGRCAVSAGKADAWALCCQGEGAQEALQQAVGDHEFFCALLPNGRRLVQVIERGVRHPLSFGRDVAAALAGAPDRADWKTCQVRWHIYVPTCLCC